MPFYKFATSGKRFPRIQIQFWYLLGFQDQRRRGVITASECRPFIRALFHYGPKVGVPVTLVVPLRSQIQKQMLSQPGRVIVCCGNDIIEVTEVISTLFFFRCLLSH